MMYLRMLGLEKTDDFLVTFFSEKALIQQLGTAWADYKLTEGNEAASQEIRRIEQQVAAQVSRRR